MTRSSNEMLPEFVLFLMTLQKRGEQKCWSVISMAHWTEMEPVNCTININVQSLVTVMPCFLLALLCHSCLMLRNACVLYVKSEQDTGSLAHLPTWCIPKRWKGVRQEVVLRQKTKTKSKHTLPAIVYPAGVLSWLQDVDATDDCTRQCLTIWRTRWSLQNLKRGLVDVPQSRICKEGKLSKKDMACLRQQS